MSYDPEKLAELREIIATCQASSDDRLIRLSELFSQSLDYIEQIQSGAGQRLFLENSRKYGQVSISRLVPRTFKDLEEAAKTKKKTHGTLYEIDPSQTSPKRTSLKKLGLVK